MKNEIKNYGFIAPPGYRPEEYIFGGGDVPLEVYNEAKDWRKYNIKYEPQFNGNFDSYGCTVWGTQNALEFLLKNLTGTEYNFAERFTYILAKVRPPGADPQKIAEIVRKTGLIEDKLLPFTDSMSFNEFIQPDPMTEVLMKLGQEWLNEWNFKHEWVVPTIPNLLEALKYCAPCVSTTAWVEENGVYVDKGQPNTHWCVLTFIDKVNGKYFPIIFDSYDHSEKILSPDHNIQFAKRYYLKKNWNKSVAEKIFIFLKSFLGLDKEQEKQLEIALISSPVIEKKEPTIQEKLKKTCVDNLGKDLSDKAPNEKGCAEAFSKIIKEVYPDFNGSVSTYELLSILTKDMRFQKVKDVEDWLVILSPTGYGNGNILNGHIGIMGEKGIIYSNNSRTGKWDTYYTLQTWIKRYREQGGYPIYFYKLT